MHALFHRDLKESSLREKRVYFCKTSDMHSFALSLFLWWNRPLFFQDRSVFLLLSFQTLIFTFHILGLWSVWCGEHHHASLFPQPGATIIIINQNKSPGNYNTLTCSHSCLNYTSQTKSNRLQKVKVCVWMVHCVLFVSGLEHCSVSSTMFEGSSPPFGFSLNPKPLCSVPLDALSLLSVLTCYACLCLPSFSLLPRPFEVVLSRQSELSYTCH